jgi:AcrR family transcriptional regulator
MNTPTPLSHVSRKEREKKQHEAEILQAACELFARKGYHSTTLDEIAHHAQFAKGTIYNYFSSKEELFFGILNRLLETNVQLVEAAIEQPGSTRDKLTAYAKAILSYSEQNVDLFRMVEREVVQWNFYEQSPRMALLRDRLHKIWELLSIPLENDMKAGRLGEVDTLHLAAMFDSLLRLHAMHPFPELFWRRSMNTDVMAQFIVGFFFEGIQQKGQSQ